MDREFTESNINDVYDKNNVKIEDDKFFEVNDNGKLKTMKNFQRLMNRLNIEGADHIGQANWHSQVNELKQKEDPFHSDPGFAGFHAQKQVNDANDELMTQKEYNKMVDNDFDDDDPYGMEENKGRLSPYAKESIWNDFHEGMSVRDISLKYGILPERTKAVVWQRENYWKEIYPKIGETGLRLGMMLETGYLEDFTYCDYGLDLDSLSGKEQGIAELRIR